MLHGIELAKDEFRKAGWAYIVKILESQAPQLKV
jgi:hypothetical protein